MSTPIAPGVPVTPAVPERRRLFRSRHDRWFGGVCGGIAATYDISSTLVRFLFIVSCLLPGPQVLFYLGAWLIVPIE